MSRNETKIESRTLKAPKITLRNIAEGGQKFQWSEKDPWIEHLLGESLAEVRPAESPAVLRAEVIPEGRNFIFQGDFELTLLPQCHRCGKDFATHVHEEFTIFLVREGGPEATDSGDPDLVLLKSDDFDPAPSFLEQIVLALPMTLLCRPDCPGRCLRCGKDLSAGPCHCHESKTDDRWAPLKDFKVRP